MTRRKTWQPADSTAAAERLGNDSEDAGRRDADEIAHVLLPNVDGEQCIARIERDIMGEPMPAFTVRTTPSGSITRLASLPKSATSIAQRLARANDGLFYLAANSSDAIRRILPDGTIEILRRAITH